MAAYAQCGSSGRAPPWPVKWLAGQPGFCRRGQGAKMVYDVCVIGSGPAGGVLSKELAEAGAKVALVEAGREIQREEFSYHAWPYEFSNRKKPTPGYPREVTEAIRYQDCDRISVDRIRCVGGRSIHWNADCFRFSERDFRERSMEGVEEDWPVSYQEMAPYYSYVEKMIGVCGTRENLEVLPEDRKSTRLNSSHRC